MRWRFNIDFISISWLRQRLRQMNASNNKQQFANGKCTQFSIIKFIKCDVRARIEQRYYWILWQRFAYKNGQRSNLNCERHSEERHLNQFSSVITTSKTFRYVTKLHSYCTRGGTTSSGFRDVCDSKYIIIVIMYKNITKRYQYANNIYYN